MLLSAWTKFSWAQEYEYIDRGPIEYQLQSGATFNSAASACGAAHAIASPQVQGICSGMFACTTVLNNTSQCNTNAHGGIARTAYTLLINPRAVGVEDIPAHTIDGFIDSPVYASCQAGNIDPVRNRCIEQKLITPVCTSPQKKNPRYASGESPNPCYTPEIVFAFFNGVQTTPEQAADGLKKLAKLYGDKSPNGTLIRYELMYNHTQGFEDFVETFEQRLSEQNGLLAGRFELFFEALRGGGSWWQSITNAIPALNKILSGFNEWLLATVPRNLTALIANPASASNYAEHRSKIDTWAPDSKALLFFAHSQGNLFANSAYSYTKGRYPTLPLQVVHVAPASPTLSGNHILASLDLVINGLRLTGTVPPITTPIPGYALRPPGLNGERDFVGHGLLEIYLNPSLATASEINTLVQQSLSSLYSGF